MDDGIELGLTFLMKDNYAKQAYYAETELDQYIIIITSNFIEKKFAVSVNSWNFMRWFHGRGEYTIMIIIIISKS